MFIGHFALGLFASRAEPRLPLGTAFLAAQLPDALWPWFLLAGVERVEIAPGDTVVTPLRFSHYPWSHSLVMVLLWGVALAFVYRIKGRPRPRGAAALLLGLVVSHWVLDWVSHRPDLPLVPFGGPLEGLGLWRSLAGTLLVEGSLYAGAVLVFSSGRRPGRSYWSLVALLAVVYFANLFGPPPPNPTAIAVAGITVIPVLWWWGNGVSKALPAVAPGAIMENHSK
jgi:membrane-bound metal-dependent hydrolase YbcI (DUF457 family)